MISIRIIQLPGSYLSAVYGIRDILGYANEQFGFVFDIGILRPEDFYRSGTGNGLVIIPPFRVNGPDLRLDRNLVEKLKKFSVSGGIPVSVCAGAFYLCSAGIADGRSITTHWQLASLLQKSFPDVSVQQDRILIDEGNFISAGGLTGFQDLSLYLIKKHISSEAALSVASVFLLNPGDRSQLSYVRKNWEIPDDDDILSRAKRYMHENLSREMVLEQIAEYCGVTVRTLLRKFQAEGNGTPARYLQSIRMDHARRLFETSGLGVKEAAFESGYRDAVSFGRIFKKLTGQTPGEYRKKVSPGKTTQAR